MTLRDVEDIVVARDLMPYLHHTVMQILFCELWVVDTTRTETQGTDIVMFRLQSGSWPKENYTNIFLFNNARTGNSIVIIDPPLRLEAFLLVKAELRQQRQGLHLLLRWFQEHPHWTHPSPPEAPRGD